MAKKSKKSKEGQPLPKKDQTLKLDMTFEEAMLKTITTKMPKKKAK